MVFIDFDTNNNNKKKNARSESIDSATSTIDTTAAIGNKNKSESHSSPSSNPRSNHCNEFCIVRTPTGQRFDLVNNDGTREYSCKEQDLIRDAVASIVILDRGDEDDERQNETLQNLLTAHNAKLLSVGKHLLNGLLSASPNKFTARVADFNDNLFYDMQPCDSDLGSIIGTSIDTLVREEISELEDSLRSAVASPSTFLAYRGSFMKTETTVLQPPHVDYDYNILQHHGDHLFIAFFPLSHEGAFVQLWKDPSTTTASKPSFSHESNHCCNRPSTHGTVVFIPYGKLLLVPSTTIHGGGFRRGTGGNLRFHLYIATNGHALPQHQTNKYTEKHDRRRELSERFLDAVGLDRLVKNGIFFDI